jgi:hypothetical protein
MKALDSIVRDGFVIGDIFITPDLWSEAQEQVMSITQSYFPSDLMPSSDNLSGFFNWSTLPKVIFATKDKQLVGYVVAMPMQLNLPYIDVDEDTGEITKHAPEFIDDLIEVGELQDMLKDRGEVLTDKDYYLTYMAVDRNSPAVQSAGASKVLSIMNEFLQTNLKAAGMKNIYSFFTQGAELDSMRAVGWEQIGWSLFGESGQHKLAAGRCKL